MQARFMAEKPEDIEFTMKITMPAKDWCELRDQLKSNCGFRWPAVELARNIDDLLSQARKTFYPAVPTETDEG
jgi:hypothetical protein